MLAAGPAAAMQAKIAIRTKRMATYFIFALGVEESIDLFVAFLGTVKDVLSLKNSAKGEEISVYWF